MKQLQRMMIGLGFIWIGIWSIFGALLGTKLNLSLFHNDLQFLASPERSLLRTAHAHMNTIGMIWVLMGVTAPYLKSQASMRRIGQAMYAGLGSGILFGAGLVLESFFPTKTGSYGLPTALTAIGGSLFLSVMFFWGVLAFSGFSDLGSNLTSHSSFPSEQEATPALPAPEKNEM